MARKVELTDEQVRELHKLAKAMRYAAEATEIRRRFKAFVDDNEDALRGGVEIGGLVVGVKVSKQLTVEEVA